MQVLIIAAFSYWFAVFSGIPQYISKVLFEFGIKKKELTNENIDIAFGGRVYYLPIRLYPFDCEKCLAFWLGVINFWGQSEFWLMAGCASLSAIVIGLIVNKLR